MNLTHDERWLAALSRSRFPNQDALADFLKVSKQVLNQIKKRKTPGILRWPSIADALGVPLEWLRDGVGPGPVWLDQRALDPSPLPDSIAAQILSELRELRAEVAELRSERDAALSKQANPDKISDDEHARNEAEIAEAVR